MTRGACFREKRQGVREFYLSIYPGVRMPPGPPPGVPPRITRPLMPKPLGVVSAKPQINKVETFISLGELVQFITVAFKAFMIKSERETYFFNSEK